MKWTFVVAASALSSWRHLGGRKRLEHETTTFLEEQGVATIACDTAWLGLEARTQQSRRHVPLDEMDASSLILDALSFTECERLIAAAEDVGFGQFAAGKNHHGALQVVVPDETTAELGRRLGVRLNRRFRFYKYEADGVETFAPHVDAAFFESKLDDDENLVDDLSSQSRWTVLLYLNGDFEGGETRFYKPLAQGGGPLTAVKPVAGAALLFPQATETEIDTARWEWPTHEGAPVVHGRAKYVIRTDALVEVDDEARLSAALVEPWRPEAPLYSPYMGVERMAPLLYDLVRFIKPRRVAEIGAGYTSLFLLEALRDNDRELARIGRLGHPKLLDWPWTVQVTEEPAQLVCVDSCDHQAQSAVHVENAASRAGLTQYLAPFQRKDAFDATFEEESLDFVWLDFGVSDRLDAFLTDVVFPALRPGAFVAVHSTLTNTATRDWLETIRDGTNPLAPCFHHISLLEPHKRFQNSCTLLQKRRRRASSHPPSHAAASFATEHDDDGAQSSPVWVCAAARSSDVGAVTASNARATAPRPQDDDDAYAEPLFSLRP